MIDIWILFWYFFEVYYHFEWEEENNMGMGLAMPPTKNLMYF
jgi:hypothetical protein